MKVTTLYQKNAKGGEINRVNLPTQNRREELSILSLMTNVVLAGGLMWLWYKRRQDKAAIGVVLDGMKRMERKDFSFSIQEKDRFGLIHALHSLAGRMKNVIDELEQHTMRDPLTGCYNHRAFQYHFKELEGRAFTLALFDLDHFKRVNDQYGHVVGDQVLRSAVQLVESTLPAEGKLYRIGGEEFAVLLPDGHETMTVLKEIQQAFPRGFMANELSLSKHVVTISMGVVKVTPYDALEEAKTLADQLLYEAKRKGRNQICVRTPCREIRSRVYTEPAQMQETEIPTKEGHSGASIRTTH